MNFVGHIHLAQLALRRDGDDSQDEPIDRVGFLLGSALPDFAAMGRFRLAERPSDRSVAAGVDLHHKTDDAFHRHPWFLRLSKTVSTELQTAGIGRGAARACGHVGIELLLDGLLLDETPDLRDDVDRATARSTDPRLGLIDAVGVERQLDWVDHLDSVASWPLPMNYRSPTAVAERLRRILARRPRLSFDLADVALVGDTLARHQIELEAGASDLIEDLDAALAAAG